MALNDCGTAKVVKVNKRQVLRTLRRHSEATRNHHLSLRSAKSIELEVDGSLTSFIAAYLLNH